MNEKRFSGPEEIDAALAGYAQYKHEKLWKEAEGWSFRLVDVVALVVTCLLFLSGLFGTFESPLEGTMQIAFSLFMLGFIMLMRGQAQMNALSQLVKKLEREAAAKP